MERPPSTFVAHVANKANKKNRDRAFFRDGVQKQHVIVNSRRWKDFCHQKTPVKGSKAASERSGKKLGDGNAEFLHPRLHFYTLGKERGDKDGCERGEGERGRSSDGGDGRRNQPILERKEEMEIRKEQSWHRLLTRPLSLLSSSVRNLTFLAFLGKKWYGRQGWRKTSS